MWPALEDLLFLTAKVYVGTSKSFVVAFEYSDAYATRHKTVSVSVIDDGDNVVKPPKLS
jgi:hypothetical protein